MSPEQLAELFHETYEHLAPEFGWKTKKGCQCKFTDLPKSNKELMVATCQIVLNKLQSQQQPATCLGCEYWRMSSEGHCMRGEGVEFCFKVGAYAGIR